jgi:23S rRNA (adenine-N6)-dimethyltransferase
VPGQGSAQPGGRPLWGWHPLRADWAERIVAGSPVTRRDVVLDLGAGLGALTRPLAATGARVIAVELHPQRAAALRADLAGERVAVVTLDLRRFSLPGRPYSVVANPPYAGVNALVRRLLADRHLLSADLVVAEAAARGLLRQSSRIRLGDRVPRHAFEHPPPSAARVLQIRRTGRA